MHISYHYHVSRILFVQNLIQCNIILRLGFSQSYAEKGVCLVYLDMWPVNLTDVTKNHVKLKCPGMRIRYVPAGGTGLYQVTMFN